VVGVEGGGGGAGETTTGGAGGAGGAGYLRTWTLRGSGADLAEIYGTHDNTLIAGDVVSIDPTMSAGVQKSTGVYDENVLGVVSTQPGIVIGDVQDPGATPVLLALAGRVPIKVNLENGSIKKGDYLTTSSTPGEAMKATKAGQIIGQALTEYSDPSAPGYIVIFIKMNHGNGSKLAQLLPGLTVDSTPVIPVTSSQTTDSSVTDQTPAVTAPVIVSNETIAKQALAYFLITKTQLAQATDISEITADRISAALEIITPTLITDTVATNTIKTSTGDTINLVLDDNGKFVIGKNTTTVNSDGITTTNTTQPVITFDSLGNATFAGSVSAKEIKVGDISGIQAITDQINQLAEGQTAFTLTASAMNSLSQAVGKNQTDIVGLQAGVTGLQADLGTLADRVTALESLLSANAFDTLNSVSTASLSVTGDSTFLGQAQFNGLSFFNKETNFDGPVNFDQTTEFKLPPIFNKDTAGFALVKEGDRRVIVTFDQPYVSTPVVTASMTFETTDNIDDVTAQQLFGSDVQYIVVNKDNSGFTILLNKNAPQNIRFSWVALGVRDPAIFESLVEGLTITPLEETLPPTPIPPPSTPTTDTTSPTPTPIPPPSTPTTDTTPPTTPTPTPTLTPTTPPTLTIPPTSTPPVTPPPTPPPPETMTTDTSTP
jgi:hypothetical protein